MGLFKAHAPPPFNSDAITRLRHFEGGPPFGGPVEIVTLFVGRLTPSPFLDWDSDYGCLRADPVDLPRYRSEDLLTCY